ncbi:hypothetical protein ABZP36_011125 [Zizania latifolia]
MRRIPSPSSTSCDSVARWGGRSDELRWESSLADREILRVCENMDEHAEDPLEHDISGIPSNIDNEEQAIPLSDTPEQYKEEPEKTYDEESKDTNYEESRIPYNKENQAKPSEEVHAFGGETQVEQQANVDTDVKKWPGWPGESVFRVLVPAQKVGAIIGRKGEFIKKMCEESRARIKVLDGPPGVPDRAVLTAV